MRYAGIKNNNVYAVSDRMFSGKEMDVVEIPEELATISSEKIILEYKFKNNKFIDKKLFKNAKDLKIALISNYGDNCGIGTYSKFLYDELIKYFADYKIFAEVGNYELNENVIQCWERGKSLAELVKEIKNYDPDVILIQHEFGLFPDAKYWISMMTQLSEYRIITTMHSVFYHQDKTIVEACMKEIIVHLDGAKDVLKNHKGISAKVHVIPHGCFPCIDRNKLWNFYKSEQTVINFGFGFRYKCIERSIAAIDIIKKKYPNVYLTILFSENKHALIEHRTYYNDLIDNIIKLNLQENVGIIRGYQSDEVLNSFLRINKAAVFSYESHPAHECFGSSGAVPYTMTKAIPVITSNVHHFENLPTIKADSSEDIARELDKLFSDPKLVEEQINKQNKYLITNSWANTAKMYISVIENP